MKKVFLILALLAASTSAFATEQLEKATNVIQESTKNPQVFLCTYKTATKHKVTTTVRAEHCPATVTVDTKTGKVSK